MVRYNQPPGTAKRAVSLNSSSATASHRAALFNSLIMQSFNFGHLWTGQRTILRVLSCPSGLSTGLPGRTCRICPDMSGLSGLSTGSVRLQILAFWAGQPDQTVPCGNLFFAQQLLVD